MQSRRPSSVASQVVPLPLLLLSHRNSFQSSTTTSLRESSTASPTMTDMFEDTGTSSSSTNGHRSSLSQISKDLQEQPQLYSKHMSVYRLYPTQTAASDRREQKGISSRASIASYENHLNSNTGKGSIGSGIAVTISTQPTSADTSLLYNRYHATKSGEPQPRTVAFRRSKSPLGPAHPRPDTRGKDSSAAIDFAQAHSGLDFFPEESSSAQRKLSSRRSGASLRIPARTSSKPAPESINQILSGQAKPPLSIPAFPSPPGSTPVSPATMNEPSFAIADRSSSDHSEISGETSATSFNTLYPLQSRRPDNSDAQDLEPLKEDDPLSFDLVEPAQEQSNVGIYALEKQSDILLSNEHLNAIFNDSKLLLKFTGFLNSHRRQSIPLLIYYLDALKAIRAINYSNAIAEALEPIKGCDFTENFVRPSINRQLEEKAAKAFEILVRDDLPAYIAYTWIQVVSVSIQRRITGTLAPHLREASEGLAEVFCLSDPSRPDNPIVFASEEFARTTQYGMSYAIGRNCRFLQGPKTSKPAVRRLAEACVAGKECNEVFVNYRRDGSPFMNLLMIAPLMDSKGTVRYYIGAQVDVSGLLKSCSNLPAFAELVEEKMYGEKTEAEKKDEFQELSEMFNGTELATVRQSGGKMHREYADDGDANSIHGERPRRVLLQDSSQDTLDTQLDQVSTEVPSMIKEKLNGQLSGVYQHYLLIRPAPSLRILFTSPSLRVPGILQSPFLNRIGGSPRVRTDLAAALGEGRGVTAKIRWLARADEDGEGEGRPRWIHCTPLLGHSGAVGVWMIVLVDEENSRDQIGNNRRFRQAPPVSATIGGKEWAGQREQEERERRMMSAYDVDTARRGGPSAMRKESSYSSPRRNEAIGQGASSGSSRGQSTLPSRPQHFSRPHSGQAGSVSSAGGSVRDFTF